MAAMQRLRSVQPGCTFEALPVSARDSHQFDPDYFCIADDPPEMPLKARLLREARRNEEVGGIVYVART